MQQRNWKLTLTTPGEPERVREVPQDEMVTVLRGLMSGELPADAELKVAERVSADTSDDSLAHAA